MSLNQLNHKQVSDEVAYNYYAAVKRMEQETGKTIEEILIKLIYDPEAPALARVQAMRLFYEVVANFLDDEQAQELFELSEDESLKETH